MSLVESPWLAAACPVDVGRLVVPPHHLGYLVVAFTLKGDKASGPHSRIALELD
ncbi:MAG TPA: hypothetical protein VHZ03_29965 [Trebonia sp.]|nr:hypothetical protein [Trebonia sp.]